MTCPDLWKLIGEALPEITHYKCYKELIDYDEDEGCFRWIPYKDAIEKFERKIMCECGKLNCPNCSEVGK